MKRVFGIDVGGMSVKFAIVDETGTIIERWSVPTNLADAGSHIPDEMISSINEKLASSPEPIVAIGAGIPGPVNGEDAGARRQFRMGQHAARQYFARGNGPARGID